jgi:hypothetical protein
MIGPNDLMVAAIAMANGITLVTHRKLHPDRFPVTRLASNSRPCGSMTENDWDMTSIFIRPLLRFLRLLMFRDEIDINHPRFANAGRLSGASRVQTNPEQKVTKATKG